MAKKVKKKVPSSSRTPNESWTVKAIDTLEKEVETLKTRLREVARLASASHQDVEQLKSELKQAKIRQGKHEVNMVNFVDASKEQAQAASDRMDLIQDNPGSGPDEPGGHEARVYDGRGALRR